MQDYPEDACGGMSEVFHGSKMLLEAPSPPTAHVWGKVYFVNEILWDECGEYFFPECFFLAPKNEKQSSTAHVSHADEKILFALGCFAAYSPVCLTDT